MQIYIYIYVHILDLSSLKVVMDRFSDLVSLILFHSGNLLRLLILSLCINLDIFLLQIIGIACTLHIYIYIHCLVEPAASRRDLLKP